MTDSILVLSGALGLLGLAIYGLLQVVKIAVPRRKRKSPLGAVTMKAAPLLLGAGLVSTPGVLSGLASLFGELPPMTLSARVVLGTIAGATATTTHSLMRKRVEDALRTSQTAENGSADAP